MDQGPRIYNLFPLLVGTVEDWKTKLPAIAGMGFNWVFLNPFHETGSSGSLYAVRDYYRLDSRFQAAKRGDADKLLKGFLDAAERAGLAVMMDLVINHTAKDSDLVAEHPAWYAHDADGAVRPPFAVNPDDPDDVTVWGDLAEIDYSDRPERAQVLAYWNDVVAHYGQLGFRGFRCDAAYQVPGEVWSELIATARDAAPNAEFFAETLGAQADQIEQLRSAGFDYIFNSAKWWDFRADWLLDQYEQFRHLAPSIAFPESHDTARVAAASGGEERESRFWYLFAAVFSTGVMMPIGYEFGFRRPLHVVKTRPDDWEQAAFDLQPFVAAVNEMKAHTPVLNEEGPQERFTDEDATAVGLLRRSDTSAQRTAVLINPDPDEETRFALDELAATMGAETNGIIEITPLRQKAAPDEEGSIKLQPREIRVYLAEEHT
ncbi:MAG: alpha-amylase family glycosyl hydrolase [Chromatiaceae bacterium]